MEIRSGKKFEEDELAELFLSVDWKSGKHPERLKKAMQGSDTVLTAWDDEKLIGLINAISDKAMIVYFPYLLVRPEYQGQGIGKALLSKMLEIYNSYFRKSLVSYDHKLDFYKKFGFVAESDRFALSIEE